MGEMKVENEAKVSEIVAVEKLSLFVCRNENKTVNYKTVNKNNEHFIYPSIKSQLVHYR